MYHLLPSQLFSMLFECLNQDLSIGLFDKSFSRAHGSVYHLHLCFDLLLFVFWAAISVLLHILLNAWKTITALSVHLPCLNIQCVYKQRILKMLAKYPQLSFHYQRLHTQNFLNISHTYYWSLYKNIRSGETSSLSTILPSIYSKWLSFCRSPLASSSCFCNLF